MVNAAKRDGGPPGGCHRHPEQGNVPMTQIYKIRPRGFVNLALALFWLYFVTAPAHSMETGRVDCPSRSIIVDDLERAGERKFAEGLKLDGIVMEIFVSNNGSWTEIWTWPNGQSCVINVGTNMNIELPGI